MASTLTRSASQTTSYQKIVPVTRKVLADLLAIFETYDYFSEDHAAQLINDIRTFLYENVIERVQFIWLEAGTNQVLDAFSYRVILNGLGLADDRSGGIRYRSELAEAHFNVRLFYNDRWNKLEEPERREIPQLASSELGSRGPARLFEWKMAERPYLLFPRLRP